MGDGADRLRDREIILEWVEYGELVRVCAVDTETGVEAIASGPRTAARSDLERIAMRLLARRLFDAPNEDDGEEGAAAAPPKRGREV